jgi:hypothetical protein
LHQPRAPDRVGDCGSKALSLTFPEYPSVIPFVSQRKRASSTTVRHAFLLKLMRKKPRQPKIARSAEFKRKIPPLPSAFAWQSILHSSPRRSLAAIVFPFMGRMACVGVPEYPRHVVQAWRAVSGRKFLVRLEKKISRGLAPAAQSAAQG